MRFLLFFSVLALIFVNGWTDAPNAIAPSCWENGLNKEPRLRFTDEERSEPALEKPIRKAEKAAARADKAQANIPKKKVTHLLCAGGLRNPTEQAGVPAAWDHYGRS